MLREIAWYQAQLAEREAQRTQKKYAQEKAKQARERFEQYSQQAEQAHIHRPALSQEETQTLRELFKKVVRKIHPDRYVNDPEKLASANRLMAQALEAYKAQDIQRLQELLDQLASGLAFGLDSLPDNIEQLQQLIETLTRRRDELILKLRQLQQEETYFAAQNPDWEAFFAAEAVKLEQQLSQLKAQARRDNNTP